MGVALIHLIPTIQIKVRCVPVVGLPVEEAGVPGIKFSSHSIMGWFLVGGGD